MNKQFFSLLFIFNCSFFFSIAQENNIGTPFIQNYSKEVYNAGTQNWDILQAKNGLMYFANNEGLLEFDGSAWQNYSISNKTIVRSLAIEETGRIYIGGQNELGYFFPDERGILTYHSLKNLIPKNHQKFEDIWDIELYNSGILFREQSRLFYLKYDKIIIYEAKGEFVFLGKSRDKIYVQDSKTGFFEFTKTGLKHLDSSFSPIISSVLPFNNDSLLITTLKDGLFLFDGNAIQKWKNPSDNFLIKNRIYKALALSNQQFAMATSQGGLLIIDKAGKAIQHLARKEGLQKNSILSLKQDASHNLWLGLDNGIDYVEIASPFTKIFPDGELEGQAYATRIFKDKIYFGTSNGLYTSSWKIYYNPFKKNMFNLIKNTQGQVWTLNEVNEQLLMGHHEGSFNIYEENATQISNINGAWVFQSLKSNPNYLLCGTYTGLTLFEQQNNYKFYEKVKHLEESCRIMAQDDNGTIWITHPYRGVYKVLLNGDLSINSIKFYNSKDGFPSDLLIHVFEISNQIIFTAEYGIYLYNSELDIFEKHEKFNKIFGEKTQVKRLVEDSKGNIWFVANDSVGILEIEDQGIEKKINKKIFSELTEQLVSGFEYIYPYDDNNVFFGLEKGFMHFNPSKKIEKKPKLKALIRKIYALSNNDSLIFGGYFSDDSKILASQNENQILEFKNEQNAFRFEFSANDFEDLKNLQFQFYLEGFDENWHDWTNKNQKEYTNLSAGKYTFHLKAKNSKQESKISSYEFKIAPAWYESNLAIAFYSLLVISSLLGLIFIPRMKYNQEKENLKSKQKQELKEKEKAIEASEKEISGIKNKMLETEVQYKNKQLASTTMHLVQKGEILIQLKKDLEKIYKSNKDLNTKKELKNLLKLLAQDVRLDNEWQQFEHHFDEVHRNFLKRLRAKFPELSPKEQKLCAYLRMNLTTKEIAPLMNISVRGVEISRYRLRKKINLDNKKNLLEFILGF